VTSYQTGKGTSRETIRVRQSGKMTAGTPRDQQGGRGNGISRNDRSGKNKKWVKLDQPLEGEIEAHLGGKTVWPQFEAAAREKFTGTSKCFTQERCA